MERGPWDIEGRSLASLTTKKYIIENKAFIKKKITALFPPLCHCVNSFNSDLCPIYI